MEERHDNVGVARSPTRIDLLPDEWVSLSRYVARRAPARHRFEPRVVGPAFDALVRAREQLPVGGVARRPDCLRRRRVRREQREAERERATEVAERFHLRTEKR